MNFSNIEKYNLKDKMKNLNNDDCYKIIDFIKKNFIIK